MRNTILILFFCIALLIVPASAENLTIDKNVKEKIFHTSDYTNDAQCIQAALNAADNEDTIVLKRGDYELDSMIRSSKKSVNIIGDGEVNFKIKNSYIGFLFEGAKVGTTTLKSNVGEAANQIIINDASKAKPGYLLRIWKDIPWCPKDYPGQTTGELYEIKSVNGNTITLTESTLRSYNISEGGQVEIIQPITVNIKNINIIGVNESGEYAGLVLFYCKNSTVTNCKFEDNGETSLRLKTCYEVNVEKNRVSDSIRPGNGYGISVIDGSAHVTINNNYVKNCRHAIMGGTADQKTLVRDVVITNNELIGANIASSNVIDAHPMVIDYTVKNNKIYPKPSWAAFADGTLVSIFSNNEVFGGYGAYTSRGNLSGGTHIIQNNKINEGFLVGWLTCSTGTGTEDTLIITNNTQTGSTYGVCLTSKQYKNIIIKDNKFSNLTGHGIKTEFSIDGVSEEITGNSFENVKGNSIYTDGHNYTNDKIKITGNSLSNSGPVLIKNLKDQPTTSEPRTITIDRNRGANTETAFHTPNFGNDAACIQAALNAAKSEDTVLISPGVYTLNKQVTQNNKDLNLVGIGNPTLKITGTDSVYGLYFQGSKITTQKLTSSSLMGSQKITIADASKIKPGYLIRIHNGVKWCPLVYPEQTEGESYLVKSVSGNTITLTEPLVRGYKPTDSEIFAYDPVTIHFEGINITDSRPTGNRLGLTVMYSLNSMVKNCVFDSAGLSNINFYTAYNTTVQDNRIYNAVKPGSGYGVAIWSGSSYAKIFNNYIENCRHTVSSNEADYFTLNRELYVFNNTLVGGSLAGAEVVDAHACTLDYHVYNNTIYPQPGHFALTDASYDLEFYNNTVYGGGQQGGLAVGRGNIKNNTKIIRDNVLVNGSYLYASGGYGTGGTLIIENNSQKNGYAAMGILSDYNNSFENLYIKNNTFSGLSAYGIRYQLHTNMDELIIEDNVFENMPNTAYYGIYLNGNGKALNDGNINGNSFKNVRCKLYSIVSLPDIKIDQGPEPQPQPQPLKPDFSASPKTGKIPLKVQFKDESTGSPDRVKWYFGDGTSSTERNPIHTYTEKNSFPVSLLVVKGDQQLIIHKYNYIKTEK